MFDELSQTKFGPIAEKFRQGKTITTEIKGRHIKVVGLFALGVSFTADGNIITSDVNFLRLFSERTPGLIDLGLIKLESGADLESVLEELRTRMPQDVKVLSKAEFIESQRNYWDKTTSIGFIVGIVIVYQILYNDVADHLPEYATLKAMGYPDLSCSSCPSRSNYSRIIRLSSWYFNCYDIVYFNRKRNWYFSRDEYDSSNDCFAANSDYVFFVWDNGYSQTQSSRSCRYFLDGNLSQILI